jgi:hypothetical protein
VSFIALAYFLNPLHLGLKYLIQSFLVNAHQYLLQAIGKLVIINHLNIFKVLFYGENK